MLNPGILQGGGISTPEITFAPLTDTTFKKMYLFIKFTMVFTKIYRFWYKNGIFKYVLAV